MRKQIKNFRQKDNLDNISRNSSPERVLSTSIMCLFYKKERMDLCRTPDKTRDLEY